MEESEVLSVVSMPEKFQLMGQSQKRLGPNLKNRTSGAEIAAIYAAIQRHGNSVKGKEAAVRDLGIGLRTLYRKLKKHSLADVQSS